MSMRGAFTTAAILLGTAFLAACGRAPVVVMGHPNPPPPPGYKVICDTARVPIAAAATSCIGVIAPQDRVVLRFKG
jgi:hypothetical protein